MKDIQDLALLCKDTGLGKHLTGMVSFSERSSCFVFSLSLNTKQSIYRFLVLTSY